MLTMVRPLQYILGNAKLSAPAGSLLSKCPSFTPSRQLKEPVVRSLIIYLHNVCDILIFLKTRSDLYIKKLRDLYIRAPFP